MAHDHKHDQDHEHHHHNDDHAFEHRLSFWAGVILLVVLIAILLGL